ncbi:MAG: aminoacylase [Gammaproteobacteria bacterium]|nr:aminoacylase [Gammaproteobacteria bacterium]
METNWDLLIRNALVFDGSGATPRVEDIAIADGRIAARGAGLDPAGARETHDADGRWLMPGLLDIHTHLDLEVELDAGLSEVVRHGTTTCVVGNCSLGTAFGAQRRGDDDPILDCFTRVENIPKNILRRCVERMDWHDTQGYLDHLSGLKLGPNLAPLIPHSMLRIEVMGMEAAITRSPSDDELARMANLLDSAMQQGYVGFSTDNIPFHYLANEPHTHAKIPSPYADKREHRRLLDVVREHDRVWQATPDAVNRLGTFKRFLYTSGRLFGKPLRTSALTAIDLVHDRSVWKVFLQLSKFFNSWLMRGKFHFQVLSTPFLLWSEGAISPIFEEFETTRPLLACDVDDRDGRRAILGKPEYIERFERDWYDKSIVSTFQRDLRVMRIDRAPVTEWNGETGADVYARLQRFQAGDAGAARSDAEREAFAAAPAAPSEARFFLHLMYEYDRDLRWHIVVGNDRPEVLEQLLFSEYTLPGFNDSGAHLINLAFFDGNLLTLQIAQRDSLDKVALAVKRLTRDPAEFFGLDVGTLAIGAQADITLIDPDTLARYDTDSNRQMVFREVLGAEQLVNRSDGVVDSVYIAGTRVWHGDAPTAALGSVGLGRPLTFAGRGAQA